MIAHVLTLTLYLASSVIYYIAFYYVETYPNNIKLAIFGLRTWDASTIINFLS